MVNSDGLETFAFGVLMWLSGLYFSIQFFNSRQFAMAKEEALFWQPGYNGILLEQHLILNRKNAIPEQDLVGVKKKCHVYICTTMYHEAEFEMEQLIRSYDDVDRKRNTNDIHHGDITLGLLIFNFVLLEF